MSAHLLYSAQAEPKIGAHKHGLAVFHDRLRVKLPLVETAKVWESAAVVDADALADHLVKRGLLTEPKAA